MRKVMIVDDEAVTRKHIRQSFPWSEWQCSICGEADNGMQALELFRREHPDILLIDLTMPEMDGFTLLEKLRDETKPHASIVLTAHRDFDFVRKAMALGASGYILKSPIDPESAKAAIERACRWLDERQTTLEQQETHRMLIRNYRYSLRRKWMDDLSRGPAIDEEGVQRSASAIGMELGQGHYVLLFCRIDKTLAFWRRYPDHDVPLVEFSLLEIVREAASESHGSPVEVLPREPGHFALLLSGLSDDPPVETQRAAAVSYHMNAAMERFLACQLNVVISRPFLKVQQLPHIIDRLAELQSHHFYREHPAPLSEQLLTPFGAWSEETVRTLGAECLELVDKGGSEEDWTVWIRRLRTALDRMNPKPESILAWLETLASSSLKHPDNSFESPPVSRPPLSGPSLAGSSSLTEALDRFHSWATQLCERRKRSTQIRTEIAQAIAYIHEHLETGLSQEKVAQVVHMSTSHFGFVFKKELGLPYLDYVLQSRIERSKEYLRSGQYRHYELADKVGFSSYPHFAAMFKKCTGMTLSEYKNAIKPVVEINRYT